MEQTNQHFVSLQPLSYKDFVGVLTVSAPISFKGCTCLNAQENHKRKDSFGMFKLKY